MITTTTVATAASKITFSSAPISVPFSPISSPSLPYRMPSLPLLVSHPSLCPSHPTLCPSHSFPCPSHFSSACPFMSYTHTLSIYIYIYMYLSLFLFQTFKFYLSISLWCLVLQAICSACLVATHVCKQTGWGLEESSSAEGCLSPVSTSHWLSLFFFSLSLSLCPPPLYSPSLMNISLSLSALPL